MKTFVLTAIFILASIIAFSQKKLSESDLHGLIEQIKKMQIDSSITSKGIVLVQGVGGDANVYAQVYGYLQAHEIAIESYGIISSKSVKGILVEAKPKVNMTEVIIGSF